MSLTERPVAIGCLVVLALAFGMNYVIPDCTNKLGLVTVNTMIADSQIWNVITSQFYEKSIIKLTFDILGVLVVSKATKIAGGFDQFGLFFLVCVVSCSFFTSTYCFIRFFLTGIEDMIMEPIYGFAGVFMTILTYGRQQLQNEPIIQQMPAVTYNNLPIIVVSAQITFWLVGLKVLATDIPFSIVAMLVSWSYLRFYYKFEDSNTLGDRSENFAFVAMFPEVSKNYRKTLYSFLHAVSLLHYNFYCPWNDFFLLLLPLDLLIYILFFSGSSPCGDPAIDSFLQSLCN